MNRRTILAAMAAAVLLALGGLVGLADVASSAPQAPPANQAPPTVSGTPTEGSTLTANNGTWTNNPTSFTYQWRRCDEDGGSCSNIGGANERTYTLRRPDVGNTIRVRVTARNADGASGPATSVPTAVVRQAAAPAPTGCQGNGPIQIANVALPDRLLIDGQSISPSVVTRTTNAITVRFRVTCQGKPVQGALVYAEAVPFNQFSSPSEQPTGADGWATLNMTKQRGFPAADRQQLLVIFARARKAGENLLAGVSTRRLVSFPVNL
jgi:hypothetical protein